MILSNLSLYVGISIIGVKFVDLLLGKRQQNWINDKFDSLAIWLDDAKPVEWFSRLATPKGQVILLAIGSVELLVFTIPTLISSFLYDTAALNERVRQLILLLIMFLSLPIIIKRVGPRISSWLFRDTRISRFLLRWIVLVIAGDVAIMVYLFVALIVLSIFGSRDVQDIDQPAIAMAFVPVFPLVILHWILTQVGAIVAIVAVTLFILELFLKIGRPIAFYISDHFKRPYFVLTGIILILLGIINLYVGHVKK
jgi:hypothetical protein